MRRADPRLHMSSRLHGSRDPCPPTGARRRASPLCCAAVRCTRSPLSSRDPLDDCKRTVFTPRPSLCLHDVGAGGRGAASSSCSASGWRLHTGCCWRRSFRWRSCRTPRGGRCSTVRHRRRRTRTRCCSPGPSSRALPSAPSGRISWCSRRSCLARTTCTQTTSFTTAAAAPPALCSSPTCSRASSTAASQPPPPPRATPRASSRRTPPSPPSRSPAPSPPSSSRAAPRPSIRASASRSKSRGRSAAA
mmetsp:Transcript_28281/g.83312  ORF Transcript_28281/g.83312 Transcript_28281/m.83312 type:complete len:248 (-) Transcript_28281:646-1389(-)